MAPIRYRLHYEDYSEHLMSRFGKLLQMQSLVDMTLMCSSHTLRVHKAVLAASSAYFQEVLQKQTGEPLIILKMRFNVLKCLVEFMYCGKTQCLEENLDELVSAAQFLKIKGLSKVTKEGLGITNNSELPVFTPPVVINRPPQSLLDFHTQDIGESKSFSQISTAVSNQSVDNVVRNNKDMVVRIPFDIEGGANPSVNYSESSRMNRPRRGRPSFKRINSWEGVNPYGRADKNLMRREQDSRKATYPMRQMQAKHIQDYVDRVTLSQAVDSICNTDSSSHSYLNMDNDLIYMDQNVASNSLGSADPFAKDSLRNDTITNYSTTVNNVNCDTSNKEINTAMSQYVNALKNAGLPTDLPILFESGDGSYINVNEQVLLDMVQSSEIQYEVIEQPNIIEKVADPSEIKSIDELSKSIERGEMLIGSKTCSSVEDYEKDKRIREDTIKSLNEILPDNLDTFEEAQNYVVVDHSLQPGKMRTIDRDNNDFSCIDNEMQFFTKSMSDDVKKFYDDQHLNDSRVLDQYCPVSTSFDTSFSMSLLDTKANLGENTSKQYNSLNNEEKRGTSCYDFTLQIPQSNAFKEDPLDCLLSTPKLNQTRENYINHETVNRVQEQDEIMTDLMNIENKIMENCDDVLPSEENKGSEDINVEALLEIEKNTESFKEATSPNNTEWDFAQVNEIDRNDSIDTGDFIQPEPDLSKSVVNLTDSMNLDTEKWDSINTDSFMNKENVDHNGKNNLTLDENIPFAVGLMPLHQSHAVGTENLLKRNKNIGILDEDEKSMKRKTKCKKI